MEASEEIKKLSDKEGNFTDLVKQYLNAKKANYAVIKADPGENVAKLKGVEPMI